MAYSMDTKGAYNNRIKQLEDLKFDHFNNLVSFMLICYASEENIFTWLQINGLLASVIFCEACGLLCKLYKRSRDPFGLAFTCSNKHQHSILKYSFFDTLHLNIRDILFFIRLYLSGIPIS